MNSPPLALVLLLCSCTGAENVPSAVEQRALASCDTLEHELHASNAGVALAKSKFDAEATVTNRALLNQASAFQSAAQRKYSSSGCSHMGANNSFKPNLLRGGFVRLALR